MTFSVKLLASAVDDIEQLYRYLHDRWGEGAANKAYLELMHKLASLASQPRMGGIVPDLVRAGHTNYRTIVHNKQTKVLYRLDEENAIIYGHMVASSKQDFQTLLYNRIMRFG